MSKYIQEQLQKPVMPSGNGAVVYVPRQWIGSRVVVARTIEKKSLKERVLKPLLEHMDKVLGVYLYGSYARNEQSAASDVDVLVVVTDKFKIKESGNIKYSFAGLEEIKKTLKENSILILPFLLEAKAIVNEGLLEELKVLKSQMNFSWFVKTTKEMLVKNKAILENVKKETKTDEKINLSNIIYSLMLRLRGIFIVKCILAGKKYSSKGFFNYLNKNFGREKSELFIDNYRKVRDEKHEKAKPLEVSSVSELFEFANSEFTKLNKIL